MNASSHLTRIRPRLLHEHDIMTDLYHVVVPLRHDLPQKICAWCDAEKSHGRKGTEPEFCMLGRTARAGIDNETNGVTKRAIRTT